MYGKDGVDGDSSPRAEACSFCSRIHRLRTDESERPGSDEAIWRHLQPNLLTPSSISASSSAVHMARPWSEPLMHALSIGPRGSGGGSQSFEMPHARSRASSAARPSSESPSECVFCNLCHRLRTASGVRPGS
eukprot:6181421-Pleurochrysis_carterae.AAC.2